MTTDLEAISVAQHGEAVRAHMSQAHLVGGVSWVERFEVPEAALAAIAEMLEIEKVMGFERDASPAAYAIDVFRKPPSTLLDDRGEAPLLALEDFATKRYPRVYSA